MVGVRPRAAQLRRRRHRRARDAQARQVADGEALQQAADRVGDRGRQPREQHRRALHRLPERVAQHDIDCAAQRDRRPCTVLAEIERDLGSRVAHADDERRSTAQVGAVAIVAAVHDGERRIGAPRPVGNHGSPVHAGREDHVAREEAAAVARVDAPSIAVTGHRADLDAEARRDRECPRIVLEIGDDLRPRHVAQRIGRERAPRQVGELADRMQVQPVVVGTPRAADLAAALQHGTGEAERLQAGGRGEAGRAGADDEDGGCGHGGSSRISGSPRRASVPGSRRTGIRPTARTPRRRRRRRRARSRGRAPSGCRRACRPRTASRGRAVSLRR